MAQPANNFDDSFFDNLFFDPTDNYPMATNDINFSQIHELDDDIINEVLSSLHSDDTDHDIVSNTDENDLLELLRILPETQQDTMAILDEQQSKENPTAHDMIDIPMPQQAVGNQNGIMYVMCLSIFNVINGVMTVKQQPKANTRFRYQCDGSRFLPDSRHHPMSITLPDLKSISISSNQTLGIVATIVTNTNNPQNQTFVHANDIIYRVLNAQKIAYGCVFVPLENFDIQNYEKKFPRFSIMYKKCDEYTFDLTPFNTSTMFGPTEKYTSQNKKNKGNAAKGKDFKEEYKLLSYKIIFQLALKQDNVFYISNISCETDVVDEQKATTTTKTVGKRSASSSMETLPEEESSSDTEVSGPSKKFKSSTPSTDGLPVTRVSSHDVESSMVNNDLC